MKHALLAGYAVALAASGTFLAMQAHRAFAPEVVTTLAVPFSVTIPAPVVEAAEVVPTLMSAPTPTVEFSPAGSQKMVRERVRQATIAAFGAEQWSAMEFVVQHESSFDPHAVNPDSGACGLGQALPCAKIGTSLDDIDGQLRWMLGYVRQRYGTPEGAKSWWLSHGKPCKNDVGWCGWY